MEQLYIPLRFVPSLVIITFDNTNFPSFILLKISIAIMIFDKKKRSFLVRCQGFILPWLFHLHIGFTFLESKERVFSFPSNICFFLPHLCLTHIINNFSMDFCNELRFMYHLLNHRSKVIVFFKSLIEWVQRVVNLQPRGVTC